MKCLLEFVSCCCCATPTVANIDNVNGSVVVEAQYRRRKRRRVGASGGGEWRPSLCSIDEDKVDIIERSSEVERTVKRKGSVRCGSGGHRDRSFRDNNWNDGIPKAEVAAAKE